MNKVSQGVLTFGIGFGLWSGLGVTASANQQYSAKRSNSVRLIWRNSMKQHALHASTGARYSKHLGIRYSNNDVTPNVTWYTDAHEKLYNKVRHTYAIYYHVKNLDGSLQGWIWRGYMKNGNAPVQSNTKATTNKNTGDYLYQPNDDYFKNNPDDLQYIYDMNHEKDYCNYLKQLFPGTITDDELTRAANSEAYTDDGEDNYGDPAAQNFYGPYKNNIEDIHQPYQRIMFASDKINGHIDQQKYDDILTKLGYTVKKRTFFAGYHIGIGIHVTEGDEGVNQGDVFIYLKPQK